MCRPHQCIAEIFFLVLLSTTCLVGLPSNQMVVQYAHNSWLSADGQLPGGVTALAQANDGSFWVGTEAGLLRFDGERFLAWSAFSAQQPTDSNITALAADPNGTLWIGTRKGLFRWDGRKLDAYPARSAEQPIISAILVDRRGTVWVGTTGFRTGQVCRVIGLSLHCFDMADGFTRGSVRSIFQGATGDLWIGVSGGLYRLRSGESRAERFLSTSAMICSIVQESDTRLILGLCGSNEIGRVDGHRLTTQKLPRPAIESRVLLADRDGSIWIGTNGQGIVHLGRGIEDRYTRVDGLSGDVVDSLFEDHEGNIWVGTDRGIDRFHDLPVVTFSSRQGLAQDLAGSVFPARNGGMWIGTSRGLTRVTGNIVSTWDSNQGLPTGSVLSIFEDRSGTLWADTVRGLFYLANGRFRALSTLNGNVPQDVTAAAEGPDGSLWFSDFTEGLLLVQHKRIQQIIPWAIFKDKRALALASDTVHNTLWIGFSEGGVANFANGVVTWLDAAASSGQISDFYLDQHQRLWITSDRGLSVIDHDRFASLDATTGLPCTRLYSMVHGNDGGLWINSACGLVRIDEGELDNWAEHSRADVHPKVFDAKSGMRIRTALTGYFRRGARSRDGRLWFPTWDGVAVIDPRHLPTNGQPPPVKIDEVTADERHYSARSSIRLPALTNTVEIRYTAFSFVAPERVRFRYRLDGYDKEWVDAEGRREAVYTKLPPKRYHFRVIAANNDGVWNTSGASLDFDIAPAFYQTIWFNGLIWTTSGLVLVGLYKLRLRHLAHQLHLRLEERMAERTRIARELHDTLLQNIAGFALQLGGLAKTVTAPATASERLTELRRMAEQWLHEARESVWDLRSVAIAGQDFGDAIRREGEKIASGGPIALEVAVSGKRRAVEPRVQEHLLRILQEGLRNAVYHSGAQKVEVTVAFLPSGRISLRIRDTGRGFDPSEAVFRNSHFGLTTIRERAEKLGADLQIIAARGKGVCIDVVTQCSPAKDKNY